MTGPNRTSRAHALLLTVAVCVTPWLLIWAAWGAVK